MEARIRAEVAERALEHEAARNRQLQAAMADLERRLGEALATAPATPPKLTDETLERLEQTFETVTRLEGAASALAVRRGAARRTRGTRGREACANSTLKRGKRRDW
jgi:type II secretory pathway component PulJ